MTSWVPVIAIGAAILTIAASIYELVQAIRRKRLWEGREDGR